MGEKSPAGPFLDEISQVKGLLLDISGVLYDSVGDEGGVPIPGSIDAIRRLKSAKFPVRFCTNESQIPKQRIAAKLQKLGFELTADEVFSPCPAVAAICKERGLRPHLLVHPHAKEAFSGIDQNNPNCVVIGDAVDDFSYRNMNEAFQLLLKMDQPKLISMGRGKYYKHGDGLLLDVGPFMKALEYSCDVEAEIVGKPSSSFFLTALKDMGIQPDNALMIGDDIINDVGGAQACGIKGVQVRTGKYRPCDEPHPQVKPDGYVDNLAQAVDILLKDR